MQAKSVTMKTENISLLIGLMLVLLFALLNFSSTGFVRTGGDENEGSGVGGTGRMATPGGESGFGGTGLKPFVSVNAENEVKITLDPAQRDTAVSSSLEVEFENTIAVVTAPLESPVQVTDDSHRTTDSSTINITESIQYSIDADAVFYQQLQENLVARIDNPLPREFGYDDALDVEVISSYGPALVEQSASIAAAPSSLNADAVESEELQLAKSSVSWNQLASYLADNIEPSSGSAQTAQANDPQTARLARPELIRRPALPPVLRVRPVRRTAILPPRVSPLRL